MQGMASCSHLDQIVYFELPDDIPGCEDCLKTGDRWFHLRMCQECGYIGCCDSSKNKHASKHFAATGHPIMRSAQPNEDWSWCFEDKVAFVAKPE